MLSCESCVNGTCLPRKSVSVTGSDRRGLRSSHHERSRQEIDLSFTHQDQVIGRGCGGAVGSECHRVQSGSGFIRCDQLHEHDGEVLKKHVWSNAEECRTNMFNAPYWW